MPKLHQLQDAWPNDGQAYDAIRMDVSDSNGGPSNALLRLRRNGVDRFVVNQDGLIASSSGATVGQRQRWSGSAWAPVTEYGYVYAQASAFAPANTNGAAADKLETATNKVNIDRYLFDAATAEQVWASIAMPEDWNLGAIKARVFWMTDSGSGGVTWGIAGAATSYDEALDVGLGSEVLVSGALTSPGTVLPTNATAAITIGGSPAQRDLIHLRVRRVPSDGSDTLAVDAALLGVWIQYTRTEAPAAW